MPEVRLQPETFRGIGALLPIVDEIRTLGDDWEVEIEGPVSDEVERRSRWDLSRLPETIDVVRAFSSSLEPVVVTRLVAAIERALTMLWKSQRRVVVDVYGPDNRTVIRRVKLRREQSADPTE